MKRMLCIVILFWMPASALAQDQPLKTEVYEIRWRTALELNEVLEGFLHEPPSISRTFNTLTITAPEGRHAVIRELIQRYDRPSRNIELQFFLLRGSTESGGLRNGVPDYVKGVVTEIGALTRYKSFELVDAPVLRASEGRRAEISGVASLRYALGIARNSVVNDPAGAQIQIDNFEMQVSTPGGGNSSITTNFKIADGETIVIGASRLGDEHAADSAIITVVTARLIE